MSFGVYFNGDHEAGNPACPRCRKSHILLSRDGPVETMPRRCTATAEGRTCGGLIHCDAEKLNPWSDIYVVECCDRCGSDGLDEV
jgi:hypothetical protein